MCDDVNANKSLYGNERETPSIRYPSASGGRRGGLRVPCQRGLRVAAPREPVATPTRTAGSRRRANGCRANEDCGVAAARKRLPRQRPGGCGTASASLATSVTPRVCESVACVVCGDVAANYTPNGDWALNAAMREILAVEAAPACHSSRTGAGMERQSRLESREVRPVAARRRSTLMIVARNGQIAPKSGHDHGSCSEGATIMT